MRSDNASQARQVILSRIRTALLPQQPERPDAETSWAAIPRGFRRSSDAPPGTTLARLMERLRDYEAQVLQCAASDVGDAVARMLTARGVNTMLVPAGFPEALLPVGFSYVHDEQLSASSLDGCDGVITTCTVAIAETGTIVLQNAPGQGRRAASLVPDYHLCLIETARIVATVPEAIAMLQPTATVPTTFISGPSATADIEMTRIKGVHGPRFLDVILIA